MNEWMNEWMKWRKNTEKAIRRNDDIVLQSAEAARILARDDIDVFHILTQWELSTPWVKKTGLYSFQ